MEANHLQPADLIGVFGSSDLIGDVIEGKRSIDKNHAEKLSDRFNLPLALFLV
jgi:HTH-type transcriptional regulator / antitoxin HigA